MNIHLDNEHSEVIHKPKVENSQKKKKAEATKGQTKMNDYPGYGDRPPPRRLPNEKKVQIDEALMKLVVKKALPASLVDNEYFIEFISLLDSR